MFEIDSTAQVAAETDTCEPQNTDGPRLSGDTRRRLGTALRAVYERTLDTQPITDRQVELLLRMRHRERDLRRAG